MIDHEYMHLEIAKNTAVHGGHPSEQLIYRKNIGMVFFGPK